MWCGFQQVCLRRRAIDRGEHPPSQRCCLLRRTMGSGNHSQPRPSRSESPPSMPVPCGSPRPNASIVHPGQLIAGGAAPRDRTQHATRGMSCQAASGSCRCAMAPLRAQVFHQHADMTAHHPRSPMRMRCRLLPLARTPIISSTCLPPALPLRAAFPSPTSACLCQDAHQPLFSLGTPYQLGAARQKEAIAATTAPEGFP